MGNRPGGLRSRRRRSSRQRLPRLKRRVSARCWLGMFKRFSRVIQPAVIVAALVAVTVLVGAETLTGPASVKQTPPIPSPPALPASTSAIVVSTATAPAGSVVPMSPSRIAGRATERVDPHPAASSSPPIQPPHARNVFSTAAASMPPSQTRGPDQVVPNLAASGSSSPPAGCVPGQSYDAGGSRWFHMGHDCRWYRGRHSPHDMGE